jgi:hypothetical protein
MRGFARWSRIKRGMVLEESEKGVWSLPHAGSEASTAAYLTCSIHVAHTDMGGR